MKIIISDNKFKVTVIFIHGRGKTGDMWNITEFGKEIGIESHISKIRNTILITLEDIDYRRSMTDLSNEIYEAIKHFNNIVCVCHSYGALCATSLSILYPKLLKSIIMLDPAIKTDKFLSYLKSLDESENTNYFINNFDQFPDYLQIPDNIILKIHINLKKDNPNINKIVELDKIIKYNMKSRLMIHVDVSHMIHYKIPHVVIDSIKNI